jgi:hypothetical protein
MAKPDDAHLNDVLDDATDAMTRSLTAISARTQLLQRRVRRGEVRDASVCLHSLDAIMHSAQDLEQGLHWLHAIARTRRRARASTRGIGSHDTWTGYGPDDERLV